MELNRNLRLTKRVIPRNVTADKNSDGIGADTLMTIQTEALGKLSIVAKKTQYVEGFADCMLMPLEVEVSQLTELTLLEGSEFLRQAMLFAKQMRQETCYGIPTISINQQRDCTKIPRKYGSDGTELKVQTIDHLHAHVFVDDGAGQEYEELGQLEGAEYIDFADPYGLAALELCRHIALDVVAEYSLTNKVEVLLRTKDFPIALSIILPETSAERIDFTELFSLLSHLQSRFYIFYDTITDLVSSYKTNSRSEKYKIASDFLNKYQLSENSRRYLLALLLSMRHRPEMEPRKFLRLIQGPALTWVIRSVAGSMEVSMSPRIFSRGNAMEILGTYVEIVGSASPERNSGFIKFFHKMAGLDPQSQLEVTPHIEIKGASNNFRRIYLEIIHELVSAGAIDKRILETNALTAIELHTLLSDSMQLMDESNRQSEAKTNPTKVFQNEQVSAPETENILHTNSFGLAQGFGKLVEGKSFLDVYAQSAPVMSNSLVLETSDTCPRLLLCGDETYVAVKVKNPRVYLENYYRIRQILNNASLLGQISVVNDIGVINVGTESFFLSKYMGSDYEAEILENNQADLLEELAERSRLLEYALKDSNIFFRNLAPRNLIRGLDGRTYIIDFDNLLEINKANLTRIFTRSQSRKLWYADIFDTDTINTIFSEVDTADLHVIEVGNFEASFYNGRRSITVNEYEGLYGFIREFERKSSYRGRDIHGHQLGRYISDSWTEQEEVALIQFLMANPDRIEDVRAVLYFASKLEQELTLRQRYGLNMNEEKLMLRTFQSVKFRKVVLSNHFLTSANLSFSERIAQFKREVCLYEP